MINHKNKFIFIHIPKCAGTSIKDHFFDNIKLDWREPNYELLYGWCPKRKIHLQHATSKQLLELDLVKPEVWDTYFKFTFVRNPYDRSYSDYLWMKRDRGIKGSFKDYILKKGVFYDTLNNNLVKEYRGDHLLPQIDFFDIDGKHQMDFIGRFENLNKDIETLNTHLNIQKTFNVHSKKTKNRKQHYSHFYTKTRKELVETRYAKDIELLNYSYQEKKEGFSRIKNLI